jgi:phage shock protein PspC (stress-responsive transcriptional regulator)
MLVPVSAQGVSVEDTLKDFWATRPRRPRHGRKIAGVAAGIGNRYGIDPIVVRVAFVVATFYGGAGVLLYLLGWLLLPEANHAAAPFESMIKHRRGSTSPVFTVVLCIALIPAFWFFVDEKFSGILGLAIVAGGLYLLHRTRGHLNRPAPVGTPFAAAPPPYTGEPAPEPGTPAPGMTAETTAPPAEPRPPAWDPLGAAPFAWDLPEPSQPAPEPPAPRKRSKVGLMTLGVTLMVAGGLAALTLLPGGPPSWITPAHAVGIVLGVIGLGLVGGSFVRGGRGLIALAVPLSIIGLGLTAISPHGFHGVGDSIERPTTISEVHDDYLRTAGTLTLDLSGITATEGRVHTNVRVDAGEVIITVPRNADVDVTCRANVGDLDCLGDTASGPSKELTVHNDGDDGPGGPRIDLHAEVGAGHVEVRRG